MGNMFKVKNVPLSDIKPYSKNAKIHSAEQIEKLAKSLETFGWQQPLVLDKDGTIVVGHGRYEAAKLLGMKEAPCKYADELTEDEIKLYRVYDNRSVSLEYDLDVEYEELQTIELDVEEFGFDTFSMDDIEAVDGYDENNDDREYFSAAFTFPTEKKEQILKYLRKHKAEIVDEIIQKASE